MVAKNRRMKVSGIRRERDFMTGPSAEYRKNGKRVAGAASDRNR